MILKFGLFFNIKNIDSFCKDELFDLSKYSNLSINFIHEKRSKDEIKPLNNVTGLKKYEGYLFRQKDSFVVYVNNISDNWITNIEFTCAKYGYEGLYIFVDNESMYPAYELYYFNGAKKRVIYSMKDGERWVFFENGPEQDFEMGDLYKERGTTKKFNYEKMKNFCMNLGVNIENPDLLIPIDTIYHSYVE
ncbi:hypothetical protein [Treponema bryantii]|uniref:hypothetical protein n=1 Tax=Treponema bryantii TaxID=163 RepID=UPI002B2DC656|nr:hypothetical protein TRBR_00690 [Treponema bryantii]